MCAGYSDSSHAYAMNLEGLNPGLTFVKGVLR